MKKNQLVIAAMAVMASVMMAACGGSKQVASNKGQEITQNICEQLQEEKPATRAVGNGTHFKEATARNIAELQARSQFARAIASKIKTSTSEEALGYSVYSGDATSGTSVSDQGAKSNDMSQSIAEGVVANTVVIKTYKTLLPNNQYQIYVCLEYQKGVSEMAADIAKRVEQRIPDEQKMKMNFEFEQYRKRIEEELNKKNN